MTLVPGHAAGRLLVLDAPLSLWGGTDRRSGRIVDRHHPQCGAELAGRVVALPSSRGSSSSSSVLAEAIRASVAPAALLLAEPDAVFVLGAIVAAELYDRRLPIVLLAPDQFAALPRGGHARVAAGPERATVEIAQEPR
jgi:hypothetical protein